MDYKFQINLHGIIDLLSNHLYSGPEVFLRELLQNGVDAISARRTLEPDHAGEIFIEVVAARGGKPATLVFSDNGVGLTEEEIHRFLATIGQTSKSADLWERPADFIGRFGIGLLSCFVVSDEIVVITRSARGGYPAVEWRGRPDGTYSVKVLERDLEPGTQVYLTCKAGSEEYFDPDALAERAAHFGGLLPYRIVVQAGKSKRHVNRDGAPWRKRYPTPEAQREALLEFGRRTFEADFFDAIPLKSSVGEVEGVAFVLPFSPSLASKRTHRVYLKGMLLSEEAEDLLPGWAFFVKCVVNANDLRPTASRESFYEDDRLAAAREALGECLRSYLMKLARDDPDRLRRLIALHDLSIKALAVQDDEFYRTFIDWLTFETTLGDMTLGEYRANNPVLRWVPRLDQFRQIARVAAAQGLCVVNGGYVHCAELLEKYSLVFPEAEAEVLDPASLAQTFEDLTLAEREEVFQLVKAADLTLQPFRCAADIKKFEPAELPALYSTGTDAAFLRSVEQSKDVAGSMWASILDNITDKHGSDVYARLCFNYNNPLVRKIARLRERTPLQRSVEMLYVQALLLGHHPLSSREMALLNEGLLDLIEWGVDARQE